MKLKSFADLFVMELQDLYSAETMIVGALPKMAKEASSDELEDAFLEHLEETRQHVRRLERIFSQIPDVKPKGKTCRGIEGIIKENRELLSKGGPDEVVDAGLIAGAQRVEHYEIAAYGTAATYARLLGKPEWERLLRQTLDE